MRKLENLWEWLDSNNSLGVNVCAIWVWIMLPVIAPGILVRVLPNSYNGLFCLEDWLNASAATLDIGIVIALVFGCFQLLWGWLWGYKDSLSLWCNELGEQSRAAIFRGPWAREEELNSKALSILAFSLSPIWVLYLAIASDPELCGAYLGREAVEGYSKYCEWLFFSYSCIWEGALWAVIVLSVPLWFLVEGLASVGRFLWVGNSVLWNEAIAWVVKVRFHDLVIALTVICGCGGVLYNWGVLADLYAVLSRWLLSYPFISDHPFLSLGLVGLVAAGWGSILGYCKAPLFSKGSFFFENPVSTTVITWVFEFSWVLWSSVFLVSVNKGKQLVEKWVPAFLNSLSNGQKKGLILLFIISFGVGCLWGWSHWALMGVGLDQLWEWGLADLLS